MWMKWFAVLCLGVCASVLAFGDSVSTESSLQLPSGALTRDPANPLLRNGPEAFDFWKTGPRAVLKAGPSNYRMWYEAVGEDLVTRVGYAVSADGVTWTKMGIVLSPTERWEANEISPNAVLFEGGVYKMWFHGGGSISNGRRYGSARIGYATSADGVRWTKYRNPVVDVGPNGSFDDLQAAEPRVIKVGTGYRMYYTGQNSSSGAKSLALATSADGLTWTKYSGNPILPPVRFGGWGGAIIFNGGVWHLWHATRDDVSGLVYKSSADGIVWTDGPSNPVLTPSGNPDTADAQAVGDSVSGYLDGDTYRIMYSGFNANFRGTGRLEAICLATIAAPVESAPPPSTSATLTANPATVKRGQSSTLTLWLPTLDYHNVTINGARPVISCGASTCTGTLTVWPSSTTTYQAAATNASGTPYAMPSTTVTVH